MWLLGPQRRGGASLPERGGEASWEVRWHHRDVAGPGAIEREREAIQGHRQRYFRSPHFRLRCFLCWCRRPDWEAAGLCPRRLVIVKL